MLTIGQEITPVKFTLTGDELLRFEEFVRDNITELKNQFSEYHKDKVPAYRRIYAGKPREESKSFPWQNASNIVIQIAGQHIDTIQAHVIASIYEISPVWVLEVLGSWDKTVNAEGQRSVLEQAMQYCALDPKLLDFYRVENVWAADTYKYGTGVIKIPYAQVLEQVRYGVSNELVSKPIIKFRGPRPTNVLPEDFMATYTAPTLADADMICQRVRLTKNKLLERKYTKDYDGAKVDAILNRPDRHGASNETLLEAELKGIPLTAAQNTNAEWDVYECWFPYWKGEERFSICCTYHLLSNTMLRAVYNFYPDNDTPYEIARLGYSDNNILGRGFCDMLQHYQEEVTVGHNQRVDKRTLLNTSVFRVATNSKFDNQFKFYPGCTIPAEAGEFEAIAVGQDTYPNSVVDEQLTLSLAEMRSGVGSAVSGGGSLGTGTVGKTTGAYSSMGTYSTMQANNRRVGANITDFKYAHMRAGDKLARIYAHFGTNGIERYFGNDAELFLQGLDSLLAKKLGFSVRAATASINREVERQNYLLLTQVMQRHYTAIGQLIQGVNNPQIPQPLRDYLMDVIYGANRLMDKVLISFSIDDRKQLLPETDYEKGMKNGARSSQQQPGAAPANPGAAQNSISADNSAQQGQPNAGSPQSGYEALSGLSTGANIV